MIKERFESVALEILSFEQDVITASNFETSGNYGGGIWGEDDESVNDAQ